MFHSFVWYNTQMGYGSVIKKIRLLNNMSTRQFGELVGFSYSYVAQLEKEISYKGKSRLSPSIDILKQICEKSGYSFRQFLEEAGYIEPQN